MAFTLQHAPKNSTDGSAAKKTTMLRVATALSPVLTPDVVSMGEKLPLHHRLRSRGDDGPSGSDSDFAMGETPPRPHHLKLLALSAELMRSRRSTGKELSLARVGLVEEARNRFRGRKERCVHWDSVEINGREFPLQRADTSAAIVTLTAGALPGGMGGGGTNPGPVDESDPSYLLVGHSVCDMCLMTFESSSVSGVITMKRITEARRDWGLSSSRSNKKYAAASNLYEPARLCVMCSQFFCSTEDIQGGRGNDALMLCGVGRSEERVSLSLESMASNKPLPDKAPAGAAISAGVTTALPPHKRSIGKGVRCGRRRDHGGGAELNKAGEVLESATTTSNCIGIVKASATNVNFCLDDLIADGQFLVKETDLARQRRATATQSSTADNMGAGICTASASKPIISEGEQRGDGRRGGTHNCDNDVAQGSTDGQRASGSSKVLGTKSTLASGGGQVGTSTALSYIHKSHPGMKTDDSTSDEETEETAADFTVSATTETIGSTPKRLSKRRSTPKISSDEAAAAALAAARVCSRTRREHQPWWEVDLGGVFPVRCVRVHHPDRRTEATKAGALPFVDVAPFWIMTAAGPIGEASPEEAREAAIASKRIAAHGKVTVWNLDVNHFATSVRVQAEGVKSLQLAR